MLSDLALQVLQPVLLAGVVAAVVVSIYVAMRSGSGFRLFDDAWDGLKPALLVLGYAGIAGVGGVPKLGGWALFGVTFAFGMLTAIFALPGLTIGRDAVLTALALWFTTVLLWAYLTKIDQIRERMLDYLALTVVGFVLMGAGLLAARTGFVMSRTSMGLAAFGGVEFLAFIISPFGMDFFMPGRGDEFVAGAIAALLFGAAISFRPMFTISLGVSATAIVGLLLPLFIFWDGLNYPDSAQAPDWTGAIALAGCLCGYGLKRAVFRLASR